MMLRSPCGFAQSAQDTPWRGCTLLPAGSPTSHRQLWSQWKMQKMLVLLDNWYKDFKQCSKRNYFRQLLRGCVVFHYIRITKCVYVYERKSNFCVSSIRKNARWCHSSIKIGSGTLNEVGLTTQIARLWINFREHVDSKLDYAMYAQATFRLYLKQVFHHTKKNNLTSGHSPATCPHFSTLQPRPLSQVSNNSGVDLAALCSWLA